MDLLTVCIVSVAIMGVVAVSFSLMLSSGTNIRQEQYETLEEDENDE